tara:strand:+ start:4752 stop:5936 length:1185 start_codon:yes stop_codon:yes gene_type:complete
MTLVVPPPQRAGNAPGPNETRGISLSDIMSPGFVLNNTLSKLSSNLTSPPVTGGVSSADLLAIDRNARLGDTSEVFEPTALIQTIIYNDRSSPGIQLDQEMGFFFKKLDQQEIDNSGSFDRVTAELTGIPQSISYKPRRAYNLAQLNKSVLDWQFEQIRMGQTLSAKKVYQNTNFDFAGWCNTMHKTSGYGNPNYSAADMDYSMGQGQNLPGDSYMVDRVVHGFVTAKNIFGNAIRTGASLFWILKEVVTSKHELATYYGREAMQPNYGIYVTDSRYKYADVPYDTRRYSDKDPNWKQFYRLYIWVPYGNESDRSVDDLDMLTNSAGKLDAVVVKFANVRHGATNNESHLRHKENGQVDRVALLRRSLDYTVHANATQRIEININLNTKPLILG